MSSQEDDMLPVDHPFTWENRLADPLGIPPTQRVRNDWYKTMEYNILNTGGFLRLSTDRGRVYWVAQNEHGHLTPDWKFHFSCELVDIPRAWNILAHLFMQQHCEIGMKATLAKRYESDPIDISVIAIDSDLPHIQTWPSQQRGREITVYIYHYCAQYKTGPMDSLAPDDESHIYHLSQDFEAGYDAPYWFQFIRRAERRLHRAGIRPRGTADGDLALPTCRYASLRNEAFVMAPLIFHVNNPDQTNLSAEIIQPQDIIICTCGTGVDSRTSEVISLNTDTNDVGQVQVKLESQYPPNNVGWNAAGHFNPMLQLIACLQVLNEELADRVL